jgi:hypothetical protein
MTAEEKWATEGPDWKNALEPFIYADWLEERGEQEAADAARWLKESGPRPDYYESYRDMDGVLLPYTWWFSDRGDPDHRLPTSFQGFLSGTGYPFPFESSSEGVDYETWQATMQDVIETVRRHPGIFYTFQKESNEHHSSVAGPVAG